MLTRVRTNLSIPTGLHARMVAYNGTVNWSALATAAFERFLDEADNIAPKQPPTIEDRVARLERLLLADAVILPPLLP